MISLILCLTNISREITRYLSDRTYISALMSTIKEAEQFRYFTEYYLKYITKYGKNPRLWGSLKHMKGNTP